MSLLILTLRTDKPEAEIGLYEGKHRIAYETWHAHRQLAETIHTKIRDLLKSEHKTLTDIQGIVVYQGPGSFTGLRIGISVANALAYGLNIALSSAAGEEWIEQGIKQLQNNQDSQYIVPEYGSPVHITKPKK